MLAVTCGGAAIVGHLFPVYLKLKGGKGVATGAGVLFAMNWMAGAAALGVWLLVFVAFRYVSLASIIAAVPLAVVQHLTAGHFEHRWKTPWPFTLFLAVMSIVVIARHADNIRRLRRGQEKRFHFTRAASD